MSKTKVLVIDDDPQIRALWDDALSAVGYTVIAAASAPEGLEFASTESVGLVLMDEKMPEMSGLEATRRLRANPRTSHIPVVLLTGSSALTSDEVTKAGCVAYLRKPVPLPVLYDLVRQTLRQDAA